jgi:5,10-methylenetetrahydromethanopterin reductase
MGGIRFGFGAIPSASVAETVRVATVGEALGFDVVWIPDQTFHRDPFVLLAACAEATTTIQLMLGVANPFTRHPVQVARAALSLDELSGGRMAVGFGAGNRDELVLRLGIDHTQVAARCREAVEVTKRLLAGETLHHRSETLVADDVTLLAPPRPSLPVYLGGRSPRVLEAAGAVADGVIIGSIASPAGIGYALDTVRAGAETAGRSLAGVDVVSWVGAHLTEEGDGTIAHLKPRVAHIIAGHRTPNPVLRTVGLTQDRIDAVKRVYDEGGKEGAAEIITDDEVGLFSLVGSAEEMRSRIAALADAGVTQVGLLLQQETAAEQEAFMRTFHARVMAPLRDAGPKAARA